LMLREILLQPSLRGIKRRARAPPNAKVDGNNRWLHSFVAIQ
jgi:hypothetical protein